MPRHPFSFEPQLYRSPPPTWKEKWHSRIKHLEAKVQLMIGVNKESKMQNGKDENAQLIIQK